MVAVIISYLGKGSDFRGGVHGRFQPGNGLPQMLHVPQGLIVLQHLFFIAAHAQVPVQGAGDDHGGDEEQVVDGVEDMARPQLPEEIVRKTEEKYREALERLTA